MQIFIKTLKGGLVSLEIEKTGKIEEAKRLIERNGDGNIPIKQWDLVFEETVLDDKKTLKYYNIPKDSTLQMTFRFRGGAKMIVASEIKNSLELEIGKSQTLADLKAHLEKTTNTPPDEYYLTFGGYILEDGNLVEQMEIIQDELLSVGDQSKIDSMSHGNNCPTMLMMNAIPAEQPRRVKRANIVYHVPWSEPRSSQINRKIKNKPVGLSNNWCCKIKFW